MAVIKTMLLKTRTPLTFWNVYVKRIHLCCHPLACIPSDSLPAYNHGLSGKGKTRGPFKQFKKMFRPMDLKGEILFGIHPILMAMKSKKRQSFHCLYMYDRFNSDLSPNVERILRMSSHMGVTVKWVNKHILNQLAGNRPHQGICLDVSELRCPTWKPEKTLSMSSDPVWLFLQHIKDPMNFGAVLRTSFYLGVNRVLVPHSNSCRLGPVTSKASAGALEVIDIQKLGKSTGVMDLCQWWSQRGGEIVGADACPGGTTADDPRFIPLTCFRSSKPVLLIMGSEGQGLTEEVEKMCDAKIHIGSLQPSFSSDIDSLNVSVAAGIVLHWLQVSRSL